VPVASQNFLIRDRPLLFSKKNSYTAKTAENKIVQGKPQGKKSSWPSAFYFHYSDF